MFKRLISLVLSLCFVFCALSHSVYARDNENNDDDKDVEIEQTDSDDSYNVGAAVVVGSDRTVSDVLAQMQFTQSQGHGFAAEQVNNQIDRIKGHNAIIVGNDFAPNGPDRKIVGRGGETILIQDKYYNSAKASIDACFDENGFRYPSMQIEVPSDQYDEAVKIMEQKIKDGKVQGVTDPKEAENIVRQGQVTYQQAVNIAKAGTLDSLKYDARNGVVSGGAAFGISTLLNYAVLRISGESRGEAVKEAAISGVKTGVSVFCIEVIAGQLTKSGAMNLFKPTSEALTKALGEEFSRKLISAMGETAAINGSKSAANVTSLAAKLIRGHVLVAIVTIVVFSVPNAVDFFRGRISKAQFAKNFIKTVFGVSTAAAAAIVCGAIGNKIYPGVGAFIGGGIGAIAGQIGGEAVADLIVDSFWKDDADQMYLILETEFSEMCNEYLFTEVEAQKVIQILQKKIETNTLKDMYQSKDRQAFAREMMTPLFDEVAKNRKIEEPSEEEMRTSLKKDLQGVVFIH